MYIIIDKIGNICETLYNLDICFVIISYVHIFINENKRTMGYPKFIKNLKKTSYLRTRMLNSAQE